MKNTTAIDSLDIITLMKLVSEMKLRTFSTNQAEISSMQVIDSHNVDRKYQNMAGLNPSDTAAIGYYMMGLGDF